MLKPEVADHYTAAEKLEMAGNKRNRK